MQSDTFREKEPRWKKLCDTGSGPPVAAGMPTGAANAPLHEHFKCFRCCGKALQIFPGHGVYTVSVSYGNSSSQPVTMVMARSLQVLVGWGS